MALFENPAHDQQVLLLDDEVVALAARAGTPWPSNTPTIDPTEEGGVRTAAFRGVTSLVMRSLVDRSTDGTLVEPLRSLSAVILTGRPVFGTFTALDDGRLVPFFGSTAVYEADGSWVTESITPTGVHYLLPTDREQCVAQASDLIERAVAGAEDVDELAFLCFVGAPPMDTDAEQSVRIARVRPGTLQTGTLREGSGFVPTEVEPSDAQSALEYVIG